jgi:SNF2 family DNA or RNA helicase
MNEVDFIVQQSGKLIFLLALLKNLYQEGHRVLIFSLSTRMLDLIQLVLRKHRFRCLRIDGTTKQCDRQPKVDRFNNDPSIFCFLLTTQVGGLGITLTAADRVVLCKFFLSFFLY